MARQPGPGLEDVPVYVINRMQEEREERRVEEERRNEV